MISMGECAFITIGIPGARHVLVALVPCPPSFWSIRLALNMASYSGISGASCVVPQRLTGSNEGWPPPAVPRTPIHWPCRSGYFASSNARAPLAAAHSMAASASAPIVPRSSIAVLPSGSSIAFKHSFEPAVWCCRCGSRRREIAQIRRRLVLAHGHEVAVLAHEIALAPDDDQIVVLAAQIFGPARLGGTAEAADHAPGPRQRMVDQCHVVEQQVGISRVETDALLDHGLIVEVQRDAGILDQAGALEAARLDLERVVAAAASRIAPAADRGADIGGLQGRRPIAPIGIDAAELAHEMQPHIADLRRHQDLDRLVADHGARHAGRDALDLWIVGLAAGRPLFGQGSVVALPILGRQRRLLSAPRRLAEVPLHAADAQPLAAQIGIFRLFGADTSNRHELCEEECDRQRERGVGTMG